MALTSLLVLAATVILIKPETPVTKAFHHNPIQCCGEKPGENISCSNDTLCEPGCYLRFLENTNTVCIYCDPSAVDLENSTACSNNDTVERKNRTTATAVIPTIGGPGVAASLLLGTLLISMFLILSVASFFYLKRSHRLPHIFYRHNKALSIFQPSETAVMIPSSSVRKQRYVRRERSSATSPSDAAMIPTTATTRVYNM
ncbi:unnamed protein product [Lota lota]